MAFIHCPKTGGSSLRKSIFNDSRHWHKVYIHGTYDKLLTLIPQVKDYYTFALVRNPYFRMISWYYWDVHRCKVKRLKMKYSNIMEFLKINEKNFQISMPQSKYIGCADFWRMEDFFRHPEAYLEKIGESVKTNLVHTNKTSQIKNSLLKNKRLLKFIYDKFRVDFERFGYSVNVIY